MTDGPVEAIRRYSRASACLSCGDLRTVERLAECGKELVLMKAVNFVRDRIDLPMCEIAMQDCMPLRTSTVHIAGTDDLKTIRKGRQGRDWLVQRIFLLDACGNSMVLFGDICEMASKTAAAHHAAQVRLWKGCRVEGHTGILISHGCWDRAIMSSCSRLCLQRNAAYALHQRFTQCEADANVRWLRHWNTSAGCSAHDFSNALRWANLADFGSRGMMRDMWIIIESLRISLGQLIRAVPRWLARCLVFDDFVGGAPALADTWRVLGLNDKWCEEFARLHLRYKSGTFGRRRMQKWITHFPRRSWLAFSTSSTSGSGATLDGAPSAECADA